MDGQHVIGQCNFCREIALQFIQCNFCSVIDAAHQGFYISAKGFFSLYTFLYLFDYLVCLIVAFAFLLRKKRSLSVLP